MGAEFEIVDRIRKEEKKIRGEAVREAKKEGMQEGSIERSITVAKGMKEKDFR